MANNPIKGADLYKDDGTIDQLIRDLLKLNTTYSDIQKNIIDDSRKISNAINGISDSTQSGREQIEAYAKQTEQLRIEQKKLDEAQSENIKTIEKLKDATKLQQSINKTQIELDRQQEGTKKALTAQLKLNSLELQKLTKEGKGYGAEADKIKQKTQQLTNELNSLNEQQKLNTQRTKLQINIDRQQAGSVEELQARLKLNRFELGLLTESGKAYGNEANALRANTEQLTEELAKLKIEQSEQNRLNKLSAQLALAEAGSYDALSAQYSINRIQINRLSQAEIEGSEANQQLIRDTEELRERMKLSQQATGNFSLNVGNYTNSIVDAFNRQTQLSRQLVELRRNFDSLPESIQSTTEAQEELSRQTQEIQTELNSLGEITGQTAQDFESGGGFMEEFGASLDNIPGAAGSAVQGVKGLSASFKALLANPIVLLIAAIVAGLSALFAAFQRSEKGARLFEMAGAAIEGILSVLTELSVSLVDILIGLWEDPLGSLKSFGQALLDNVINRFLAIIDFGSAVADLIGELITGNFDEAGEAAERAGRAIVQFGTGLDTEQQNDFAKSLETISKGAIDTTNAFIELNKAQEEVRTSNRALNIELQQQTKEEERLAALASDQTKSLIELKQLNQELNSAQVQRAQTELRLAQNNANILAKEIELRRRNGEDVRDLLDEQVNALGEVAAAESALTTVQLENTAERNQIRQDEIERNLDILIDNFDSQKSINERLLQDERLTADQKQKILENTQVNFEKAFQSQIAQVQQLTTEQIDANALVAESDNEKVAAQIANLGVSDVIAGRLLEIIRERRTAVQDLNEAERDLQTERLDRGLEELDQIQELKESEFALRKKTAREQVDFELNLEKERLEETLRLNLEYNETFTDIQEQTILNQIEALNRAIDANSSNKSLLERLGLNLNEDQIAAISEGFNNLKSIVTDFAQARVDAAEAQVEASEREVDQAQSNLDTQIELANLGYANNVEQAQRELELAKQNEEQALQDKREALQAQQALQTVEQTANLITAASKIWSQVGNPLIAIPLITLMFGAFASAKIKAASLATETFGDGGLEILEGGSHASGNDIFVGVNRNRELRAEGGEAMAIINKKQTSRYNSILPDVIDSLNGGYFEDLFMNDSQGGKIDLQDMPNNIRKMANKSTTQRFKNSRGQLVEVYKNVKTTWIN